MNTETNEIERLQLQLADERARRERAELTLADYGRKIAELSGINATLEGRVSYLKGELTHMEQLFKTAHEDRQRLEAANVELKDLADRAKHTEGWYTAELKKAGRARIDAEIHLEKRERAWDVVGADYRKRIAELEALTNKPATVTAYDEVVLFKAKMLDYCLDHGLIGRDAV